MQDTSEHGRSREMVSFRVGEQEFCIDIDRVREIRGWTPATPLPHTPAYVRGVVNLRGAVLPIVEVAERLGMPGTEPTAKHVIIVTQCGNQVVGLLVTAVCDILIATNRMIQPVPDTASGSGDYVEGLITYEGRMVSILDTDRLLPGTGLAQAA